MRDFEVKNAKIFWGGLSPPQTPPNNEEGDTPSSNSSTQCREDSNFLSFIPPHQRILDPSLPTVSHVLSVSSSVIHPKRLRIKEVNFK